MPHRRRHAFQPFFADDVAIVFVDAVGDLDDHADLEAVRSRDGVGGTPGIGDLQGDEGFAFLEEVDPAARSFDGGRLREAEFVHHRSGGDLLVRRGVGLVEGVAVLADDDVRLFRIGHQGAVRACGLGRAEVHARPQEAVVGDAARQPGVLDLLGVGDLVRRPRDPHDRAQLDFGEGVVAGRDRLDPGIEQVGRGGVADGIQLAADGDVARAVVGADDEFSVVPAVGESGQEELGDRRADDEDHREDQTRDDPAPRADRREFPAAGHAGHEGRDEALAIEALPVEDVLRRCHVTTTSRLELQRGRG